MLALMTFGQMVKAFTKEVNPELTFFYLFERWISGYGWIILPEKKGWKLYHREKV
jgi:hypothetical protein